MARREVEHEAKKPQVGSHEHVGSEAKLIGHIHHRHTEEIENHADDFGRRRRDDAFERYSDVRNEALDGDVDEVLRRFHELRRRRVYLWEVKQPDPGFGADERSRVGVGAGGEAEAHAEDGDGELAVAAEEALGEFEGRDQVAGPRRWEEH